MVNVWIEESAGVTEAAEAERERRFLELVTTHRERAVALAWRLLGGDRAAAEDVAQEAFVRAHRGLGRFRGDASITTWFFRILVNEAHRHRRWRWVRMRRAAPAADDPPDPRPDAPGDPVLRARIARAMEGLPQGQREAFVLVHLEGFSASEAASITGKATGTIKAHVHRALRALRRELADAAPEKESS